MTCIPSGSPGRHRLRSRPERGQRIQAAGQAGQVRRQRHPGAAAARPHRKARPGIAATGIRPRPDTGDPRLGGRQRIPGLYPRSHPCVGPGSVRRSSLNSMLSAVFAERAAHDVAGIRSSGEAAEPLTSMAASSGSAALAEATARICRRPRGTRRHDRCPVLVGGAEVPRRACSRA